ncbi:phosphate acyltransferase PlsX [Paenibacillus sp. y28]|uniref:phosphate acyltransferase PlsX n=1 Tax=Paenibacillus sp. y28 TaxID=3129110 RepID=UPI0030181EC5
MRIVIDAMGGDNAPESNVQGALLAAKEWPDTEIILVGHEAKLRPLLTEQLPNLRIHHAEDEILAEDEPAKAVRRKKASSMVVAGKLVREKEADAMISAGNTGALVVTGLLVVGRISGIDRPALAPMMPTADGVGTLALDLGANPDASAQNLLQFAIMGSLYRSKVDGMAKPRIGLLNVGTEAGKGNELTKAVYPLLESAPIHFVGSVEARGVLTRDCDVLVCDGFTGNVMLKAMEGAAGVIFSELKREFKRSWLTKLSVLPLMSGLKALNRKMDYNSHGAAPLLGVNGLVLKSHGSSKAETIKNAVRQARSAVQNKLVEAIASEISEK